MFCKNCGKPLSEGDRFCSRCGTKVEEEFIPAFRKQEEPSEKFDKKQEGEKTRRKITTENFNWDLDGYPIDRKKTEDVDFNWDSVIEENQRRIFEREQPAERRESGQAQASEESADRIPVEEEKDSEEDISLEEQIFADMGKPAPQEPTRAASRSGDKSEKIDKFYTFNKKNEEFQALLDREYERIKNGGGFSEYSEAGNFAQTTDDENQSKVRHEEFDWTLPGDRPSPEPQKAESEGAAIQPEPVAVLQPETPQGYTVETVQSEPATPIGGEEERQQGPEEASFPPRVEIAAEEKTEPKQTERLNEEQSAEVPEERAKLTFDDVFGADDDDASEKPAKKGKAVKTIAIILCILVAAELVVIGIQYFAPDSAAGKMINRGYEKVLSLFSGSDDEEEEPDQTQEEPSETARLIEEKKELNQNIALIEEDQSLTFEDGETYEFDNFENTYTFADKPWYTDDDGNSVSYGGEIIGTVIGYYSAWVDKMNGKNDDILTFIDDTSSFYMETEALEAEEDTEYGINKLAIGEIRAGGAGFYVMTAVTTVDSKSNQEQTQRQIVYMEPVSRAMEIVEIKVL